jgi:ParB family chromosome partitioning protein
MAKKALGKGLGALFPEQDLKRDSNLIDLSSIRSNPFQPRMEYSESEISGLINSIKSKGVIQPIVVRKKGKSYELVCGERRYRAAKKVGLKKIPAVVKDLTDREVLELAIIENLQRKDLNPIEEAKAFHRLIKEFGLTQTEIAKEVGRERSTISNTIRLLKLPQTIQTMVLTDEISEGHARALLSVEDETVMISLANEIKRRDLSVRDTERLIQRKAKKKKRAKTKDLFTTEAERILREKFGTRCLIQKKGNSGKLIIEYYSQEDLKRIFDILSINID